MDDEALNPPYRWAALTGAVIFALYVMTLSPTTAFWDTSEYIAAAKVLGIPHPPGNPLFTLLAHVWGMMPLGNYARRINLFAAFTSAAGAGFWFLVADRWMRNLVPATWPRRAAAFAGVFASATAWTVWNQSTVNEKVYTVSLLSIAMMVWCMVRWADLPDSPRRNGLLVLACYLGALTSTNHMMGVLAIPVIAIYVLWTQPRLALQPWIMLMAWTLAVGVSGILGDALTVIHAMMYGDPGMTGNFANPAAALTVAHSVDGSSLFAAGERVAALLGIVGLFGWGVYKDRRNPLLYVGFFAILIGLSINYIYLPIRAGQYPLINEGEPTGFFSQGLSDVLNRLQYGKPGLLPRQPAFPDSPVNSVTNLGAQLWMYGHYWVWQWSKDVAWLTGFATVVFTGLTGWGLFSLIKRDRRAGVTALFLTLTLTALLIWYLNFKFAYSYHAADTSITNDMREVRERDYFYLASFAYAGVLIACGFGALMRVVGEWLGDRVPADKRWATTTPVLALALIPLFGNRLSAPRNHETLASDFAVDMLQSVEPYGILITAGDNDTFPLWFAQEVLGIRRDITLANLSLMNTDWHLRQLRRRITPTFDPAAAPPMWRPGTDTSAMSLTGGAVGTPYVRPTTPVFAEPEKMLDSIADVMMAPKDSMQLGTVWIKFGTQTITKSDIATLFLIKDNAGKRPIYFSWSDGGYPDQTLGLEQYLVTVGMVRKLMPEPVIPHGDIINSPMGLVDVNRTRQLMFGVYHPDAAAHYRPLGWFDPPSASILSLYEIVYNGFSQVLQSVGDTANARKAVKIVTDIQKSIVNQ